MEKIRYYYERSYPYLVAIIIFILLYKFEINFISNRNFNDAIDGISTISSLIIGFLGAILPVILGMKNESKFVKYVFENDTNKLFLKYIKENIISGLLTLVVSFVLYFRDEVIFKDIKSYIFYFWVALIILFLLQTYRCLSKMLGLIFSPDNELVNNLYEVSEEKKKEREKIENEYIDKFKEQDSWYLALLLVSGQ